MNETPEVIAVIDTLFMTYLKRDRDRGAAETLTRQALIALDFEPERARRAAAYVAGM